MTRSKTFWAVAALLSLGVAAFSGYSVYERLALHMSGDTVELKPSRVPPPEPSAEPPEEEEAKQPEKPQAPEPGKPEEPKKPKAVRTVFEYKDARAKSVQLEGSFTSWRELKMSKKDGVWRKEEYILPGTYPYHFIVDGKKKADPGKPLSPSGDSLVTVAQ